MGKATWASSMGLMSGRGTQPSGGGGLGAGLEVEDCSGEWFKLSPKRSEVCAPWISLVSLDPLKTYTSCNHSSSPGDAGLRFIIIIWTRSYSFFCSNLVNLKKEDRQIRINL